MSLLRHPSPFPAPLAPLERPAPGGDGGERGTCDPDASGVTEGAGGPFRTDFAERLHPERGRLFEPPDGSGDDK